MSKSRTIYVNQGDPLFEEMQSMKELENIYSMIVCESINIANNIYAIRDTIQRIKTKKWLKKDEHDEIAAQCFLEEMERKLKQTEADNVSFREMAQRIQDTVNKNQSTTS
jgi:hypothetical protein